MVAVLQEILDQSDENIYVGAAQARKIRDYARNMSPQMPVANQWRVYYALGNAELKLGNEEAAITALQQAYQLNDQINGVIPIEEINIFKFDLAIAYLRLGETQNCCQRNTPDSCIVPIRGSGIHTNRTGSTQAIKYFKEVLQDSPPKSELYLKSRWLLNVAYMTLGEHPQGVPKSHLISTDLFASDGSIPRFFNVAERLGLNTFSNSGGAIIDDFDGDDQLDVVTSSFSPSGRLRYFQNQGDQGFRDRSEDAGFKGMYGGLNLVQADYDNDGDTDILVLRGAWLYDLGQHPNSLLRNRGDGTFDDVTFESGLGEVHYPTQTASWADFDNDGDLDLYIGNESTPKFEAPSQLFRNDGTGRFTDVASQAGVTNDRFTKAVVWGDYNEDRLPDIYVSNYRQANRLYRNNGNGSFTDVAVELGVTQPDFSFPAWFWDFDNDGHLDILVADYRSLSYVAANYVGATSGKQHTYLYRGLGGRFQEISEQCGLAKTSFAMGANFGDLDNDGFLDFYLGTGDPHYASLAPNIMYRNHLGQRFDDVTMSGGFGHLQKGHAVVFADLDSDGDQDVFEQLGGALAGDKYHDALFENPGFGNRWVTLKLIGTTSNRSAIGARIRVQVVVDGVPRSIYKYVNSGGSFGANPLRQMIGLGLAKQIQQVEIYWPTTDQTQTFKDLPMNTSIEIVEGNSQFRVID